MDLTGAAGDNALYYIAMLAIYSGLGPWLLMRLTRGRSEDRAKARAELNEALELVSRVGQARAAAQEPAQRAAFDTMLAGLVADSTRRIEALNAATLEDETHPERRYVIVPTPRSVLGVILTTLFILCVYLGLMMFLTLGFDIWNFPDPALWTEPASQRRTMALLGLGSLLLALGFFWRWLAFRLYAASMRRARGAGAPSAAVAA